MTTRYVDLVNGNNANDGSTFALRKLTLASAVTGLTGGDTVRVMASPAAASTGINATWTNGSDDLTLASALTANIDTGDAAWTASANVTATASTTTRREGTASASLVIATAFTTGLVAYKALGGSTDFSAYKQISLQIRTTGNPASGVYELRLCSDAAGVTAVNTITIPALTANSWTPVVVDLAAALGSAIQSVALYAISDPGGVTVFLDNIIACKDSTAADSITHMSLFGKVDAGSTSEPWMIADSINGTAIKFGTGAAGIASKATLPYVGRYYGATATQALYKREPIILAALDTVGTGGTTPSGLISRLLIEGGYDRTAMASKSDATFVRSKNTEIGIFSSSPGTIAIEFSNFGFTCQGSYGLFLSQGNYHKTTDFQLIGCFYGVLLSQGTAAKIGLKYSVGCAVAIYMSGSHANTSEGHEFTSNFVWGISSIITGTSYAIQDASSASSPFQIKATLGAVKNMTIGLSGLSGGCFQFDLFNTTFEACDRDISMLAPIQNLYNVTLSAALGSNLIKRIRQQKTSGDATAHSIFPPQSANVSSATDQRHTASDFSWKYTFTTLISNSEYPLSLSVAKVACPASETRTVTLWFRRNNTGCSMRLRVKGGYVAGIASDLVTNMTAAADTWEQVTLSFTPTEKCVVEVFAEAWSTNTSYVGWVDDLGVS